MHTCKVVMRIIDLNMLQQKDEEVLKGLQFFVNRVPNGELKIFRYEPVQVDKSGQLKTDLVCWEDSDSSPASSLLGTVSDPQGRAGASSFLYTHLTRCPRHCIITI